MKFLKLLSISVCACLLFPISGKTETCTMYQKYIKDRNGTPCANQGSEFVEVTPSGGSGTYYARKIPKCDINGTDIGCLADEVKSLDGTRAFYHVDAVPSSNKWVIFFEGGGSCSKMLGQNAAQVCYGGAEGYIKQQATHAYEMTTKHANGQYVVDNQKKGTGILSTNVNNPFSTWNRILVNKSTYDRFMGNKTSIQTYETDAIKMFFHGRRQILAMLKDLDRANGIISVPTGEPFVREVLPDLSEATTILFAGESGGAGGIIHNAEWLKSQIALINPAASVNFAASSRMLPWIEAEAHFGSTGAGIWDLLYSGTSEIEENGNNGQVTVTYNEDTFRVNGDIREQLDSWGDVNSKTDPFMDQSCKNAHPSDAEYLWRCYDEGHVALYHTNENMFFYESLDDGVHNGSGSPVLWIETYDCGSGELPLEPGFVWKPANANTDCISPFHWYNQARADRVIYTIDSILLGTSIPRGFRAFYAPFVDGHTVIRRSEFYNSKLFKPGSAFSFAQALSGWVASPADQAWVEDVNSREKITWKPSPGSLLGGGWVH